MPPRSFRPASAPPACCPDRSRVLHLCRCFLHGFLERLLHRFLHHLLQGVLGFFIGQHLVTVFFHHLLDRLLDGVRQRIQFLGQLRRMHRLALFLSRIFHGLTLVGCPVLLE